MAKRYLGTLLSLALLIGACGSLYWSRSHLQEQYNTLRLTNNERPPLYLPSVRYVKLITLGYNKFFSNLLWFNTISYFGKHYNTDKDFRWMGHMCDLVTSLDPEAQHVYEFCSTMLSWAAREPEKSKELLDRAIEHHPEYWRNWYLRGFTYWYFLEDKDKAQTDLSHAATLPQAPAFLASLASRLMVAKNEIQTAIKFLRDLIANTKDDTAKEALRYKLKLAYISRDTRIISDQMDKYEALYKQRAASLDELVQAGLLRYIPLDPFGKPYEIDPETGAVRSSSGGKGLEFFGKSAKTGLAKNLYQE